MESKSASLANKRSKRLQIEDPHVWKLENEKFGIEILGGIKLNGLDRLRVTLKIENAQGRAIRDSLDLYNDYQTEKFIRRAAERLETRTTQINPVLQELTNALENHRLEQLRATSKSTPSSKTLSPEEKKEALAFLKLPYLLKETQQKIGESGVIGEENNRLLMYLIFTSRKRPQPLHIVSLGSSGIGKTHLQESVSQLIPQEDKLNLTSLSENAFYYFERKQLSHKLIVIEDLDGAQNALYPIRELQTKKKISKTIAFKDQQGNIRTQHLIVEGPLSVAGCTTRERIYEDNANRSFLIYMDESKEQDEKIMAYQRAVSAGQIDLKAERQSKELLQNTQRLLQPIAVRNPYAPQLKIPEEVLKPRRTNNHYLQFIEAVTFYHQWQRHRQYDKETGEEYIETTKEDIAQANELLKEVLLRKSDGLSGACRNYFESLKNYLSQKQTEDKPWFSNRQMSLALQIPYSTIKRYHGELLDHSHIQIAIKTKQKNKGYQYEITDPKAYKNLQERIHNTLDAILKQIKNP